MTENLKSIVWSISNIHNCKILLNDFIERNWKTLIWQNWKIPLVLISTVCFKRAQQFLISQQTLQNLKATKFLQDLACLDIIILLDVV